MPIKNNWLSNNHSFGTGYKKGYKDGYAKAIEDVFEIMDNAEAHSSDWDEHGLYYWVGFLKNRIESELKGKE